MQAYFLTLIYSLMTLFHIYFLKLFLIFFFEFALDTFKMSTFKQYYSTFHFTLDSKAPFPFLSSFYVLYFASSLLCSIFLYFLLHIFNAVLKQSLAFKKSIEKCTVYFPTCLLFLILSFYLVVFSFFLKNVFQPFFQGRSLATIFSFYLIVTDLTVKRIPGLCVEAFLLSL